MNLHKNQQGFASIVVALVLILVLSLMTVGFAELMQREQRNSLDKQLSNQAYYAAETGLNDAVKAINAGFNQEKSSCQPYNSSATGAGIQYLKDNNIEDSSGSGNATGASYTCLLIDEAPYLLRYSTIDGYAGGSSTVTEISGVVADGTTPSIIGSLMISWSNSSGVSTFVPSSFGSGSGMSFGRGDSGYPDTWPATTGVLRASLTPLISGGINRQYLDSNTYSAFLYPNSSGSSSPNCNLASAPTALPASCPTSSFASNLNSQSDTNLNAGVIADGNCNTANTPYACNVVITNLSQANYLLDLRSIYSDSQVAISAFDSNGNQLRIRNAQISLDSTGKAQDVLRRIQARVPYSNGYVHPDYSLESVDSICKQ